MFSTWASHEVLTHTAKKVLFDSSWPCKCKRKPAFAGQNTQQVTLVVAGAVFRNHWIRKREISWEERVLEHAMFFFQKISFDTKKFPLTDYLCVVLFNWKIWSQTNLKVDRFHILIKFKPFDSDANMSDLIRFNPKKLSSLLKFI